MSAATANGDCKLLDVKAVLTKSLSESWIDYRRRLVGRVNGLFDHEKGNFVSVFMVIILSVFLYLAVFHGWIVSALIGFVYPAYATIARELWPQTIEVTGNGDTVAVNGDTVTENGDTVAGNEDTVAGNEDTVTGNGDTVAVNGDTVTANMKWFVYWTTFAIVLIFENPVSAFLNAIKPFYYLFQMVFFVWCFAPIENNGTEFVYGSVLWLMVRYNHFVKDAQSSHED